MKTNIYAIIEKNSNRAIAIIESGIVNWFEQDMQGFDIIKVGSVGTCTFSIKEGNISTVSIYPEGKSFSSDAYHIIQSFPEEISLKEAYQLIKK